MQPQDELLEALPVAVYTTDAEGRITFYNRAAAELWGYRPEIGSSKWCGSWRIYRSDGQHLPHDECPMAVSLKEGRPVWGVEAVAERPDGTRVPFMPYPTPLRDSSGQIVGAINLLVDLTKDKEKDLAAAQLAAIVEGSDDAIVSKTLEGRITSWNRGATRIFGYEADEMVGQLITRIIPPELHQEEADILARLGRGERIEHFDTVRVTKDGRRLNISLTVSPLRDRTGTIVGASKVGRDITERKRAEELQALLIDELNHRVKNTLATIQAIASQSLRRAPSLKDFGTSFNGRIQALARAHDLLVENRMKGCNLKEIIRDQVTLGKVPDHRISVSGPSLTLDARTAMHVALVLYELATNARKYGGLSLPEGRLALAWAVQAEDNKRELVLTWKESGVPEISAPASPGFGTILIERTLQSNGGHACIRYDVGGITCELRLPLSQVERQTGSTAAPAKTAATAADDGPNLTGKRILLVEDEPLVAMEVEADLIAEGCIVIGPAASIEAAQRLVAEASLDAALVDANLAGRPVDEIAAALTQKGIPFAFATGYGRQGLPLPFRDAPLLMKPFQRDQLIAMLREIVGRGRVSSNVVQLEQPKVSGDR